MKKITVLLSVAMFAFACGDKKTNNDDAANNNDQVNSEIINNPSTATEPEAAVDPNTAPNIAFEQDNVKLSDITEGEAVEVVFKYTNTGKADLVLSAVEPSCGCTVANEDGWSREPLKPGDTGKIKVVYNSDGRGTGLVDKAVTIRSNALPPNDSKEVRFTLNVNPKK